MSKADNARRILRKHGAVIDQALTAVVAGADRAVCSGTKRSADGVYYEVVVGGVKIWSSFVEFGLRDRDKFVRKSKEQDEVTFAMLALLEEV